MRLRAPGFAAVAIVAAGMAVIPGTAQASGGPWHRSGTVYSSAVVGSVPSDPVVHGVAPGNLPWTVRSGSVRLSGEGRLTVKLKGLVFTDGPFTGTAGPVTAVSASLYCGDSTTAADTTETVPLSARGNARIDEVLDAPDRCVAPTVLVHPFNATSFYIAASGVA
jgi:hypothetical protein